MWFYGPLPVAEELLDTGTTSTSTGAAVPGSLLVATVFFSATVKSVIVR